MRRLLKPIIFMACALLMINVAMAASNPLPKLQNTANSIISQLKANQSQLKSNPSIAYNIVKRYLVPLVNQGYMAKSVIGRTAWNKASNSQKQQFISEFTRLVINVYAAAFSQFTDEAVKFMPIRGSVAGKTTLQVQSKIVQSGRPSLSVNYNLLAEGNQWKIIDFSVNGISMVQSYRAQFAPVITSSGLSGLINQLKQHNSKTS